MKIYVALGTYERPGTSESIGDPLVIEDDDHQRWMITGLEGERLPYRGPEDDLHELRGLNEVSPGEFGMDLVGVAEIAQRAHVSTDSVRRWRLGPFGFPLPLHDLAAGPVWSWQAVDRWLRVARPSGRPAVLRDASMNDRERWARSVRDGDAVMFSGVPRTVLAVRTLGQLAPYFRFDDSGVWYSYTRAELDANHGDAV